jgi:hypothetical protein
MWEEVGCLCGHVCVEDDQGPKLDAAMLSGHCCCGVGAGREEGEDGEALTFDEYMARKNERLRLARLAILQKKVRPGAGKGSLRPHAGTLARST